MEKEKIKILITCNLLHYIMAWEYFCLLYWMWRLGERKRTLVLFYLFIYLLNVSKSHYTVSYFPIEKILRIATVCSPKRFPFQF